MRLRLQYEGGSLEIRDGFRHTYCTLPRSLGVEFKVIQELMRHSSLRSTLDVYTQAVGSAKRAANVREESGTEVAPKPWR